MKVSKGDSESEMTYPFDEEKKNRACTERCHLDVVLVIHHILMLLSVILPYSEVKCCFSSLKQMAR